MDAHRRDDPCRPGRDAAGLSARDHDAPSVFTAANMLREARRQRGLASLPVPAVCLLDPDGDVVRHLAATGTAQRHPDWACYHSELWVARYGGRELGIVGCAVGAPSRIAERPASRPATPH